MDVLHKTPLQLVWQDRNRSGVLAISAIITLLIGAIDWWTTPYVSMGFLYLFPIMFSARFLTRWMIVTYGIVCAVASENFSSLQPSSARFVLTTLAVTGCGLLVGGIARQSRYCSKIQLKDLAETSPAAILTIDERGLIEFGNSSAVELLQPRDGLLAGQPVAAFLPDFHHELRMEGIKCWKSTHCEAHRGDGGRFNAGIWFSSFKDGNSPKVAAIITDVNRESFAASQPPSIQAPFPALTDLRPVTTLNTRETEIMRLLMHGFTNKQIALQLTISESSVKNALQQLFAKTGVRTRTQLVRIALESQPPTGQSHDQPAKLSKPPGD